MRSLRVSAGEGVSLGDGHSSSKQYKSGLREALSRGVRIQPIGLLSVNLKFADLIELEQVLEATASRLHEKTLDDPGHTTLRNFEASYDEGHTELETSVVKAARTL